MVRFPSQDRAGAGYQIDAGFPGPGDQGWRANVRSRARRLLALFLLTDVGPDDAPTRLVRGSHLTAARFLGPYGEAGADGDARLWYPSTLRRPVAHATGTAGDVFLCHPFIVHTATWPHRGTGPRMIVPARPGHGQPDHRSCRACTVPSSSRPRSQGAGARQRLPFICCNRTRARSGLAHFPHAGHPWPGQQWQSDPRGPSSHRPQNLSAPTGPAGDAHATLEPPR
jgi:hypothetical protein